MAGCRKDRGLYDGRNVSGVIMWLKSRRNRGQYVGRNISGARMWLEVGETGDCMMDAMCQDPGCGWM